MEPMQAIAAVVVSAIVATLIMFAVWYHRFIRDGEWHPHYSWRAGMVMRRFCGGIWHHREMTDADIVD